MPTAEQPVRGHLEPDRGGRLVAAPPAQRILENEIHRVARRPVVPPARRRPHHGLWDDRERRDRQTWFRRGDRGDTALRVAAAMSRYERAFDHLVDERRWRVLAIGRAAEHTLERVDAAVEHADREPGVARQDLRPSGPGIVLLGGEAVADRDDVVASVERSGGRERRHEAMLRQRPAEFVLSEPADAGEIAAQRLELPPIKPEADDAGIGCADEQQAVDPVRPRFFHRCVGPLGRSHRLELVIEERANAGHSAEREQQRRHHDQRPGGPCLPFEAARRR